LVVNAGYGAQDAFQALGRFEFASRMFAGAHFANRQPAGGGNRWRGSWLGRLPVPVSAEFLLGIDAQQRDFEAGWPSYLRGELRSPGWWYYYLYGMAIKNPVGTILLVALGCAMLASRRYRTDCAAECIIAVTVLFILQVICAQTGLNHHVRYTLVVYPFLFLSVARLGRCWQFGQRYLCGVVLVGILATVASTLRGHPQELAYFNEMVGGPAYGHRHLLESNIDWGQDLIRLRRWLQEHPDAEPLFLAYHSQVDPEVYGIRYRLAPLEPQAGWYAISTNLLMGVSYAIPDGRRGREYVPPHAFSYLRQFEPIVRPGYGLFVYHLSVEDVEQIQRQTPVSESIKQVEANLKTGRDR
jgi:hypothetical protein